MEGRKYRGFSNILLAVVIAAGALGVHAARGDAMAAVDLLPIGPNTVAAGPTVVKEPAKPVMHVAAAGGGSGMTVLADSVIPVGPAVGGSTPPVAPKTATVEPVATTTQPSSETVAPAATKPAETVILPIEHDLIRPKADEPAAGGTPPKSGLVTGLYSTLQVAAALAIVLGLVLIGRALMRKFVPGAKAGTGKGVIETLARYPLGRNQSVVLLRIGSQIVALNQTKEASQSILVISEPLEVAKIIGQIEGQDPSSIQANFNRALSNARMDLESPDAMDVLDANRSVTGAGDEDLDQQLEEMAAAKRQLMELRAQVRSVRDNLPA